MKLRWRTYRLTRLSVWLYLFPRQFIERDPRWQHADVRRWSRSFTWRADPGWDFAQDPWKTYMEKQGDCEDYALAVLHMLMETTNRTLRLGFCGSGVTPKHVVVHDGHHVYSSGQVYEDTNLDEYLEDSEYEWMIERQVR